MIIIKTVAQKSKKYNITFTSKLPKNFLVHGRDGPKILCADGIVYYSGSIKMYIVGKMFFGRRLFYRQFNKK